MSSEVSLSLANALTDLAARRSNERPAMSDRITGKEGGEAAPTTFGMLVRDEAGSEGARETSRSARARQDSRQNDRLMPGELPRPERQEPEARPERPEARAEDRPAPRGKNAPTARRDNEPARGETARAGDAPEKVAAPDEATTDSGQTEPAKSEAAANAGETVGTAATETTETVAADPVANTAEALLLAAIPAKSEPAAPAPTPITAAPGPIPGTAPTGEGAAGAETPAASAIVDATAGKPAKDAASMVAVEAGAGKPGTADPAAAKAAMPTGAASATIENAGTEDAAKTPARSLAGETGATGAAPEAGKTAKTTQPGLHPVRTSPFAEVLESFHAGNVHRPADILAGLERNHAPQAARAETVSRPTPLQMLPIEIGMQAVRGATQFQIRLDPAELGRIDVQLQIKENGEVNANLVVDRVETLAMLRRDASTLQQAFEQAGLRQSSDGLSFSLRGEGQQGENRQGSDRPGRQDAIDEAALANLSAEVAMRRVMIPNASIDRMI